MSKVVYEFNLPDDADDLALFQNSRKIYLALGDVYDMVRTKIKYGEEPMSEKEEEFLEQIQEIASIVHAIDE